MSLPRITKLAIQLKRWMTKALYLTLGIARCELFVLPSDVLLLVLKVGARILSQSLVV